MAQPPPQPTLLCPFGDQSLGENNWFRVAFRYDRAAVLEWMKDVASRNNPNCPPQDLRTDDHFELLLQIYTQLESLVKDGVNFNTPAKHKCHIYRDLNPKFGKKTSQGQSQDCSEFLVKTWTNDYNGGPDARVIQMDYWCIYDLIGLFFGLLGSAPLAANKNNFFLPLTAVYARWCTRLAGKLKYGAVPESGVGPVPEMYQCTWRERDDGKAVCFFLGASLGGDQFGNNPSGKDWKKIVQKTRFDMLVAHQQSSMVGPDDFNRTEPEITDPRGKMTLWGNCAETYPFAHCMKSGINSNEYVQGLALGKKFIDRRDDPVLDYSGYCDDTIWLSMAPPCNNCQLLLQKSHANESSFAPSSEIGGATCRNPPAPPEEPEVEAAEVFVIRDMKEPPVQEMVEVASN